MGIYILQPQTNRINMYIYEYKLTKNRLGDVAAWVKFFVLANELVDWMAFLWFTTLDKFSIFIEEINWTTKQSVKHFKEGEKKKKSFCAETLR